MRERDEKYIAARNARRFGEFALRYGCHPPQCEADERVELGRHKADLVHLYREKKPSDSNYNRPSDDERPESGFAQVESWYRDSSVGEKDDVRNAVCLKAKRFELGMSVLSARLAVISNPKERNDAIVCRIFIRPFFFISFTQMKTLNAVKELSDSNRKEQARIPPFYSHLCPLNANSNLPFHPIIHPGS